MSPKASAKTQEKTKGGFGRAIIVLRQAHAMSQHQLALKLGVTASAVAQWEAERREPNKWNYSNLIALAQDLNLGEEANLFFERAEFPGSAPPISAESGDESSPTPASDPYSGLWEDLEKIIGSGNETLIGEAEDFLRGRAEKATLIARRRKAGEMPEWKKVWGRKLLRRVALLDNRAAKIEEIERKNMERLVNTYPGENRSPEKVLPLLIELGLSFFRNDLRDDNDRKLTARWKEGLRKIEQSS